MTAERMWQLFLEEQRAEGQICGVDGAADCQAGEPADPPYDAWAFGVEPDELAQLVLSGKKQGTASAYALYEIDGEELPPEGEYNIILDGEDQAVCITKTTKVYLAPFNEVSERHARLEGEGDLSLECWRQVHKDFFRPQFEEAGLEFTEDALVVCEEFERVWPKPDVIKINDNSWRIEDHFVRLFLLEGKEKALLVDSGISCPNARSIAESITDLPVELINTHADPDHISGNAGFERFYMHPAEEPNYRMHDGQGSIVPVEDGSVIDLGGRALEVIHLPGHTAGSIALYEAAAGVLISGDSVQTDSIFMFGPRRSMDDFIKSMEKLQSMADWFKEIWPSHGAFPAGPGLIGQLLEGARSIVSGNVTGTIDEHRGTRVVKYKFPYAGFICDIK